MLHFLLHNEYKVSPAKSVLKVHGPCDTITRLFHGESDFSWEYGKGAYSSRHVVHSVFLTFLSTPRIFLPLIVSHIHCLESVDPGLSLCLSLLLGEVRGIATCWKL